MMEALQCKAKRHRGNGDEFHVLDSRRKLNGLVLSSSNYFLRLPLWLCNASPLIAYILIDFEGRIHQSCVISALYGKCHSAEGRAVSCSLVQSFASCHGLLFSSQNLTRVQKPFINRFD